MKVMLEHMQIITYTVYLDNLYLFISISPLIGQYSEGKMGMTKEKSRGEDQEKTLKQELCYCMLIKSEKGKINK